MSSASSSLRVSLSLFAVYILAKPLQALSPHSVLALPQLLPASNLSTGPALNTSSSENVVKIICSGEHFGYHPNIADCESAKEYITPDSVQYTWGERHTGLGSMVIPLPHRIMGGQ